MATKQINKANGNSFLASVDVGKVESLLSATDENAAYFKDTCEKVVRDYAESLDNLMSDLYAECVQKKDPPLSVLEGYYLELTNMIYFMGGKQETLGIYSDVARSASKEVWSKSYLSHQVKDGEAKNKTTVAECQAQAELDSQYEAVVTAIYDRAYSMIKYKIVAGQDMMNCLRRIISTRTAEMDLSKMTR